MQHTENNDAVACQLIAQLIPADHKAPDIASIDPVKTGADPRQGPQSALAPNDFAHSFICSAQIDRSQKAVEAFQILQCQARPYQPHGLGSGSGVSVPKLLAQASTRS